MPPRTRVRALLYLLLLCRPAALPAQTDPAATPRALLETLRAEVDEETDEQTLDEATDRLTAYLDRPLDLNRATPEQLADLLLLSPLQIDQLLQYRARMDGFISIYELQVLPAMDTETLRRLAPFVRVGKGELDDTKANLGQLLRRSDRTLFLRWNRRLERARGYQIAPNDSTSYYLGDANRYFLKLRARYGTRLSAGLIGEKDPGEPFLRGPNRRRGFDYWSAHLFLRRLNRRIRALALGDFTVSFGQGLIAHAGFGYGKSGRATSVARGGPVLRPYAGATEFGFRRGAGLTLAVGKHTEWTLFASRLRQTANVIAMPKEPARPLTEEITAVSSLGTSGLHRTRGELADRKALTRSSYGTALRYRPAPTLRLGLNLLGEHLSHPLQPRAQPYNRYYFRGTDLLNASIDYRRAYRNFSFFGEVAASHSRGAVAGAKAGNGKVGTALLHGLQVGLDRSLDLAIVYRRYGVSYQALDARPFGETSGGRNEEGIYVGLELRPAAHWTLTAYYDLWRHEWLRFRMDRPSTGREWRTRLTYRPGRHLGTYAEVRSETKGYGTTHLRVRFDLRTTLGKQWDWRSRLDWGFTKDPLSEQQRGLMLYQDLIYSPEDRPWRFTGRVATFYTDGYDVRFYQYEAGLTYNSFVLPYYGRGTRAYLVVRYRGIRGLTLEARIARTSYAKERTLGSGLERIEGRARTEVGAQVIWRF